MDFIDIKMVATLSVSFDQELMNEDFEKYSFEECVALLRDGRIKIKDSVLDLIELEGNQSVTIFEQEELPVEELIQFVLG